MVEDADAEIDAIARRIVRIAEIVAVVIAERTVVD
jgi:hypothetical protein